MTRTDAEKAPTKEQIENERKKLLEMKPKIRQYSAFGDNHYAAIMATLRILDGRDTAEDYEDAPDNVRDEAAMAEAWMRGEKNPDYESPTISWQSLVRE